MTPGKLFPVEFKYRFRASVGVWTSILLALMAGLGLRLYALHRLFQPIGDSLIYGDIAKNLLQHGVYGLTQGNAIVPTLIRLPGYPFLLIGCFRLFGVENYYAAACLQIALELAGCLLLADFARRIAPATQARRAAHITLWLAALCPFTASYCATPLAETPTLFAIALALWSAACFRQRPGWNFALLFTFAVTWATLLRPDGALVAVALAPALLLGRKHANPDRANPDHANLDHLRLAPARLARMALVCVLLALAPFALWTVRNWQVFHVFQPLAPRLATDPGEDPHLGWEAWVKSWCLDFNSTYFIYWNVPDDRLDVSLLPERAFDSPAQRQETRQLADDYNQKYVLTPEIDARFAHLAAERAALHPWRTHLWLPLGRMADMWLRPRNENLPVDIDWWDYRQHRAETRFSWTWAGLNLAYLLAAAIGLSHRPRFWLAMLAYMVLRSALLTTVEAPEARYTLECFPMLFALAGVALATSLRGKAARS
ncbi:glycosyltransferase family 39 protein [Telmatobacter bradus]|uniref:glycosyltransferase family 39 protein n=1 Tax=Telmatobacter bradus TaxID=474953 RepID=UPI003B433520